MAPPLFYLTDDRSRSASGCDAGAWFEALQALPDEVDDSRRYSPTCNNRPRARAARNSKRKTSAASAIQTRLSAMA